MSPNEKPGERRKEERLVPQAPVKCGLWSNESSNATTFLGFYDVVNLSRFGLGLKFEKPDCQIKPRTQSFAEGTIVYGSFELHGEKVKFSSAVRVISETFLGLEYVGLTSEFLLSMKKILAPVNVAQSIYPLARESLDVGVWSAFRGLDFECVMFRAALGKSGSMIPTEKSEENIDRIQFFLNGVLLELTENETHVIPKILIGNLENSSPTSQLLLSFKRQSENPESKEISETLSKLLAICGAWKHQNQTLGTKVYDVVARAAQSLH